MTVLLVEDNSDLAASVIDFLELEGIESDYAQRGDQALALIETNHYDAIILDLNLPQVSGLTVCHTLRQSGSRVPVIMLTALDTLKDKLTGFDMGADDYLVKPFDMPELAARLRVLLGRSQTNRSAVIAIGDLRIDIDKRQITRADDTIEVGPAHWKLLAKLARSSPNVVSRSELERELWQESPPDSEALKSHLYTLRKLIDKPYKEQLLHTYRGIGVALKEVSPSSS